MKQKYFFYYEKCKENEILPVNKQFCLKVFTPEEIKGKLDKINGISALVLEAFYDLLNKFQLGCVSLFGMSSESDFL